MDEQLEHIKSESKNGFKDWTLAGVKYLLRLQTISEEIKDIAKTRLNQLENQAKDK
jgi:hypothetical protein